ncbi:hypothetical protein [Hyphococcus luteus]|uniref:hypothetical protein n=1 Tax=Hyphococcus luteus TaxID=2058213 RepID=UPI0010574147|nr:hypothetical protein [Marinicaulis flavus]
MSKIKLDANQRNLGVLSYSASCNFCGQGKTMRTQKICAIKPSVARPEENFAKDGKRLRFGQEQYIAYTHYNLERASASEKIRKYGVSARDAGRLRVRMTCNSVGGVQ